MKYYDARVIENCCVFSYEVKTPDRSSNKGDKRKKASVTVWKKALLRFILFLLLPFAWIIDTVVLIAQKTFRKLSAFFASNARGYIFVTCALSPVPIAALMPLLTNLF